MHCLFNNITLVPNIMPTDTADSLLVLFCIVCTEHIGPDEWHLWRAFSPFFILHMGVHFSSSWWHKMVLVWILAKHKQQAG